MTTRRHHWEKNEHKICKPQTLKTFMQKNSNQVSTFKKNYLVSIRKPTGTVIDETKCKDNKRKKSAKQKFGIFPNASAACKS